MIRPSSGRLVVQGVSLIRRVAVSENLKHRRQNSSAAQSAQRNDQEKPWYHTPAEGYVRLSPFETFVSPEDTLDKYVWQDIHRWETKTAAICIVSGRQYTYAEMRDRCAAFAVRLQNKLKLQSKDIVAVCLPNLPEYPIAALGLLEAGLAVTTVNHMYNADEISRQLESSSAKALIGTVGNYATLKTACDKTNKNIPIICIKTKQSDVLPQGTIDFFEFIDPKGITFSDLKPPGIRKEGLAFLPYSSGTTGLPKGVVLSHENITNNCEMIHHQMPFGEWVSDTTESNQDVIPCVLPFFHIYGLTVAMISMLKKGCKLVTLPKFTPDDLIKSVEEYKGNVLNLVPPLVLFLTNSEKITAKQAESLRIVISGAAPIGLLDAQRFMAKFPGKQFSQGYGLTETSPVCMMTPHGTTKYASAGFVASKCKAKIVAFDDPKAIGLGPNQPGELCFQGPHVMQGYLNNDEANRNSFYPDRWFRTGDIGHYDEEGFFYITDRMKELIKVKGFQVPPAELEEILRDHPKILDAAVIGIPDQMCGELPRAFVVLRKGVSANAKEIQDFVADKVIEYKRLEGGVTFLDEIPKTASGKILRKNLKAQNS